MMLPLLPYETVTMIVAAWTVVVLLPAHSSTDAPGPIHDYTMVSSMAHSTFSILPWSVCCCSHNSCSHRSWCCC
jgi:hypothetical protein